MGVSSTTLSGRRARERAGLVCSVVAVLAIVAGCDLGAASRGGPHGPPDARGPDGGVPRPDVGPVPPDVGRPRDAGPPDAPDSSYDACVPCATTNPCEIVSGCEPACEVTLLPDGTACPMGTPTGICIANVCTPAPAGCGDGVRVSSGPEREGCDDGNFVWGDACSPTCSPTLLVVSAPSDGMARAPVGAAGPSGLLLFAWVETVPPTMAGAETTQSVYAQRFTTTGLRVEPRFTLDTGIGVGEPLAASVASQAAGWVVTWRSPSVEGPDGELGGIAYRTVPAVGMTLGMLREANSTERLDQREPRAAAMGSGFVIAWADGSDGLADPGYGVRARLFDAAGNAASAELTVPTSTDGDQSQPVVAAAGTRWMVAWTDTGGGTPVVRARRYDGASPLDGAALSVSGGWGYAPTVSRKGSGTWLGWLDRTTDPDGDVRIAFLDDAASTVTTPLPAGLDAIEDGVAVAATDTLAFFGYRSDTLATTQGLRLESSGAFTFAPEIDALRALMVGYRQRDLSLLATPHGLWASWSQDDVTAPGAAPTDPPAVTGAVAYLLPWD